MAGRFGGIFQGLGGGNGSGGMLRRFATSITAPENLVYWVLIAMALVVLIVLVVLTVREFMMRKKK